MSYLYDYLDPSALLDSPGRIISSLSRSARFDSIAGAVVRMLIIGALAAGVRRAYNYLSTHIERALFPTAYIHHTDPAYQWIRTWLATDQAAQAQIRDFQLFTEEWRSVRKRAGAITVKEHNATWTAKDIIGQVLPSYQQAIRIKHNGNYLWIRRSWASFARTGYRNVDHWQVRTIAFRPNILKDFLVAAHQNFFAKEDKELLIFHAKRINPTWQNPVSRPARPWSSVILPGNVKEDLLRDVQKFLSEKEMSWYAARGIPHRRGYLFAGEPGSGKTTLTTAIASKLRLDIYVINPAQRGMDDAKLSKLFRDCPAKSIILIEDIDCIFPRGRGRNAAIINGNGGTEDANEQDDAGVDVVPDAPSSPMVGGSHDLAPSTVTLSGLLNAIDGVSSQEGCILVASTNHPERLDPALSRAGRFDVRLTFADAIPGQARALFLHFYPLADFQQIDHADETSREKASLGISSQADLDILADDFAAAVFPTGDPCEVGGKPSVGVSMAALQGYLLQHKEDPRKAVEAATEWARGLEKEKEAKKALGKSALGAPPAVAAVAHAGGSVGKVPLRKKVLKRNNGPLQAKRQPADEEVSEGADETSGESVAE